MTLPERSGLTSPNDIAMSMIILSLAVAAFVVIYDIAACLASRSLGFNYAYASFGSLIIYAGSSAIAAKVAAFEQALPAGAVAGIADATLGWWISWKIGPGRMAGGALSLSEWFKGASTAVGMAMACAAAGAWLALKI